MTTLGEAIEIRDSTNRISVEIFDGRLTADDKHGENSIESTAPLSLMWLAILGEEFGEAAHELTYDAGKLVDVYNGVPLEGAELAKRRLERLRAELVDVATVVVAWIASIDRA